MKFTVDIIASKTPDQGLLYQQAGLDQYDVFQAEAARAVEQASVIFLSI